MKELGNFETVGRIRDIPNLTFDIDSFDVSTEIEALLTFTDPSTTVAGSLFNLSKSVPLDVISPFKPGSQIFTTPKGVVCPYLTLESSAYKFGVKADAQQTHTLRGDSYFFVPGTPYYQEYAGDGVTGPHSFTNTAVVYNYAGASTYALGVCVVHADGTYKRLFHTVDYTDSPSGFTLLDPTVAPLTSTIRVVYGSTTIATYPQSVHQGVSVKPAALRGKDIDVYVGTNAATPVFTRWTSVQSVDVTRKVTLDADEEFGNPMFVGQDYDVPDVTGSIMVRPRDLDDLYAKVFQVANVNPAEVAGPHTSVALPVEIRLSDPDTHVRLKTFYIPDARFIIPGIQGRVGQKTEVPFPFTSDSGTLYIYKGNRAGT